MKKALIIAFAVLFCLSFIGCGGEKAPESAPAPTAAPAAPTAEPVSATAPPVEVVAAAEDPEETEEASAANLSDPAADAVAVALSLVDHPVADLYEALGEPESSEYASSCLVPDGQDGILHYDGFTVYTLVDAAGNETVYDAE